LNNNEKDIKIVEIMKLLEVLNSKLKNNLGIIN